MIPFQRNKALKDRAIVLIKSFFLQLFGAYQQQDLKIIRVIMTLKILFEVEVEQNFRQNLKLHDHTTINSIFISFLGCSSSSKCYNILANTIESWTSRNQHVTEVIIQQVQWVISVYYCRKISLIVPYTKYFRFVINQQGKLIIIIRKKYLQQCWNTCNMALWHDPDVYVKYTGWHLSRCVVSDGVKTQKLSRGTVQF